MYRKGRVRGTGLLLDRTSEQIDLAVGTDAHDAQGWRDAGVLAGARDNSFSGGGRRVVRSAGYGRLLLRLSHCCIAEEGWWHGAARVPFTVTRCTIMTALDSALLSGTRGATNTRAPRTGLCMGYARGLAVG